MVAPAIGVFLVQRRLALLGDGMGHVAHRCRAGIPDRQRPRAHRVGRGGRRRDRDRSVADSQPQCRRRDPALVFYGGIAGGVLLTYLAGNRAASSLNQYLFGAITTVSSQDLVWLVGALVGSAGDPRRVRREMFAVRSTPRSPARRASAPASSAS